MERDNAAEWDLHRRPNGASKRGDTADGWQTVSKPDKGKGRATQALNTIARTQGHEQPANPQPSRRNEKSQRQGTWQDARGRPLPPRQQQFRAVKLLVEADGNEAQAQWRALEAPRFAVRVPKDLVLADGENTLQRLARQHLSFVASDQRPSASLDTQTFGIWGSEKDAQATRGGIAKWINEVMGPQKSGRAAKFAKLSSMTPTLRMREENRWKREVQRQRYRQHPPLDMAFGAIGTFHWPVKDYSPTEILGPNYEALDPIRMDCSCYVIWKKSSFQVLGKNMDKVKAALLRLKQAIFQIAAKQLPTSRMYLLHWHDLRCTNVLLEQYGQPKQLSGPPATEIKQHPGVRGEGVKGDQLGPKQNSTSEKRVHSGLMRMLSRLPYYRGSMKLRFHFGRFLATQYMLPENGLYSLEEYESMTKESQFQGLITPELADREMEQSALKTLQHADGLLTTLGAAVDTLPEVAPTYSVVFTFADPKMGDVQLSRSWQAVHDHTGKVSFDSLSQKWTRLDRETHSPTSLVDYCLTDLTTSFGWAFTITASQALEEPKLPTALLNFNDSLTIDPQTALKQSTDRPFVKFNAFVPGTVLKGVEQKITYAYGMKEFDYNVELARSQRVVYPENGSVLPGAASQNAQIFEPRWGVSVYRVEWDTFFAENERISVGQKANWSVDSERWFPRGWSDPDDTEPERCFSNVVGQLSKLGELLREGGKVEDLLGGMSVG